jgi:broad specificity phosphatase PhoE
MRIFLVRHGETIFNANRTVQSGGTPLSERGIEQTR